MLLNLGDLREDYNRDELLEDDASKDPFQQFAKWFKTAVEAEVPEPNAMVLATSTANGRPSARVVLLKEVEAESFVFYTNYESRKGQDMAENPHAAIVFNWLSLHRQVRVEGLIEKIPGEMSTEYFQSRPKGSQIGAWASPQSQLIPHRQVLEDNVRKLQAEYSTVDKLPRPKHWGGYRLVPHTMEFWQGRTSRLHDRILYRLHKSGVWEMDRLAP